MDDMAMNLFFHAGDIIFDTHEPLDTAFFILEGSVDLEVTLNDEVITVEIGPNHFLGDAAVAVKQKNNMTNLRYKGRAVAKEVVKAVPIPVEDIRQELDACPPLLKAWFASFISRVLMMTEKLSQR